MCVHPHETFCTSCPAFSMWSSEKRPVLNKQSVSCLFLHQIVNDRNSYVRVQIWWNVRWSWIVQTLLSVPFFWRTKKSIWCKLTGFGSGLFDFLFLSSCNKVLCSELIFFAVPTRGFGFTFRPVTELISDDRRGTAEVNNEKLAELDDGWSLVFTEAGWFTRASSEVRGKSHGLKMFLSQGKRPVTQKPLATI
jgi:hypothetical protein